MRSHVVLLTAGIPDANSGSLNGSVICPSVRHTDHLHYDTHNLFGYLEAKTMQR